VYYNKWHSLPRPTLLLVPRGEVVQTLQISGVKSGVIWTTS
jgi:hypothetical protein